MSLIVHQIHPQVSILIDLFNLDLFNYENYIFDNIHANHDYLQSLDPRNWKDQDHYAVLRLGRVRINASQELIKQAYRKQLLDHHPDKGKQRLRKCDDENNDYFTCITRAFDLLKDPTSRISYDSVDPQFDDSIPTIRNAKDDFFGTFRPVFERNSRWSKQQPVPSLGDENSEFSDVFSFYRFWDEFNSWREFSYLDEENKSQADCREERRYIDKINKSERKKKSAEEAKRINGLVELAKQFDPRIQRYNALRKAEKDAEKKAKADRKLERKIEAETREREEREKLEREEADRQQKLKDEMMSVKKQKEIVKTKQKTEKRRLRKTVENCRYFENVLGKSSGGKSVDMQRAEMMNIVDMLCVKMPLEELGRMNDELERLTSEEEMLAVVRQAEEKVSGKGGSTEAGKSGDCVNNKSINSADSVALIDRCGDREWSFELTQFLIKSINCHPPGTKHRWNTIAEHMNLHNPGLNVKEKQVIQRAKLLKTDDSVIKKEAAAHNLVTKADVSIEDSVKSVRISEEPAVSKESRSTVWSLEEQKLLEAALKAVATSDPARWDKISDMVRTRTKRECILRFKECAEKMKAKKAAQ